MYTTVYGSLIIVAYIFNPEKVKDVTIKNIWKSFTKGKIEFPAFGYDEEWMDKMLRVFGYEINDLKGYDIAFVTSKYNCLFAPMYNGQVLPLREDGIMARTLTEGKVYKLDI